MPISIDLNEDLDLMGVPELKRSGIFGLGLVEAATQTNMIRYGGENHVGTAQPESPALSLGGSLWRGAAFMPGEVKKSPDSYVAQGDVIDSIRLKDESGRLWWLVVEHAGSSVRIYLHRPITTFFFDVPAFSGNRQLASIGIPDHLTDEEVSVSWSPTGRKIVVQIVSDLSDKEGLYGGGEPLRYSMPWAQVVKVIDITGTGSWPLDEAFGGWGLGIDAMVSGFEPLEFTQEQPVLNYSVIPKRIVGEGGFSPGELIYEEDGIKFYSGTYHVTRQMVNAGYSTGNYAIEGWDIVIEERLKTVLCVMISGESLTGYYVELDRVHTRNESYFYESSGDASGWTLDDGYYEWEPSGDSVTTSNQASVVDIDYFLNMTSDSDFTFRYEYRVSGAYGHATEPSNTFENLGEKVFLIDGEGIEEGVASLGDIKRVWWPQIELLAKGRNHFNLLFGSYELHGFNGRWSANDERVFTVSSFVEMSFFAGGAKLSSEGLPEKIYYRADNGLVVRKDQSLDVQPVELSAAMAEDYRGIYEYRFISNQQGSFVREFYKQKEGFAPERFDGTVIPWLPVGWV